MTAMPGLPAVEILPDYKSLGGCGELNGKLEMNMLASGCIKTGDESPTMAEAPEVKPSSILSDLVNTMPQVPGLKNNPMRRG